MDSKIHSYRDLNVWKLGVDIVMQVYRITQIFPRDETYGLVAQLRRAAVSIPSNVAEGFSRFHNKEYKQFLFIALGSCSELETQIEISCKLRYLSEPEYLEILEKIDHESRMVRNLIKKL